MNTSFKVILTCLSLCISAVFMNQGQLNAQKKINPPFPMPDVNIIQVGEQAYAFCGTDLEPYNFEISTFIMPYWRLFSSNDLVNWTFESYLDPRDTYIGETDKCFAGHGVYKNDKWYWYFSNYVKNTGVAISESPKGPWTDALGKPLLPEDISITKEYDGCVFTDDDGQSYMIYGAWKAPEGSDKKEICYHIAALNDDMISLKETPIKIQVNNIKKLPGSVSPVDAPFMHKKNGKYYLSWRTPYAVADNIYGPYEFKGVQDAHGHLGFFTFNNQDFVNYTSLNEEYRRRYRFASIAYVYYYNDGTIAKMEKVIAENGVGEYSATWPAIEAEWYMACPDGPKKLMLPDSNFAMANLQDGNYLNYPNIHDCKYNAKLEIKYACGNNAGGTIVVKTGSHRGPEFGKAEFVSTGSWENYETMIIQLDKTPPGSLSLCLVVEGEKGKELIRIDNFKVLE